MPMIEPDLLRIQRRSVRLCRAAVADLSRAEAEAHERSRKEQERAQRESNLLETRASEQIEQAHAAHVRIKEVLRRRGLQRMAQMAPAHANAPSSGNSDVSRRLSELVDRIQASERRMESYLVGLDRSADTAAKFRVAILAALAILAIFVVWLFR